MSNIKRPIDRSKKTNIKCEHCGNWSGYSENSSERPYCKLTKETKYYWNRCKGFSWNDRLPYKEE